MTGMDDFESVRTRSRDALDRIAKGDPAGYEALFSRRDDVTLGNPFGGFGRGWEAIVEQVERAASHYTDGETIGFETIAEYVSPEWAYTVEIERFRARVGGRPDVTDVALRVTCVYRREEDGWRLVHRHADPAVERQSVGSVIQG
jgi:ketosteroid isomerase-like protein